MRRIIADQLFITGDSNTAEFRSGPAFFYSKLTVNNDGTITRSGNMLFSVSGESVYIDAPYLDIAGNMSGRGLSATVKFNNDTYIVVKKGIITAARGVDNSKEITGYDTN